MHNQLIPGARTFLRAANLVHPTRSQMRDKARFLRLVVPALLFTLTASAGNQPLQRADYHLREADFRALQMRDENGKIPPNAMLKAIQQKQQMQVDARAWPGTGVGGTAQDEQLRT